MPKSFQSYLDDWCLSDVDETETPIRIPARQLLTGDVIEVMGNIQDA